MKDGSHPDGTGTVTVLLNDLHSRKVSLTATGSHLQQVGGSNVLRGVSSCSWVQVTLICDGR